MAYSVNWFQKGPPQSFEVEACLHINRLDLSIPQTGRHATQLKRDHLSPLHYLTGTKSL